MRRGPLDPVARNALFVEECGRTGKCRSIRAVPIHALRVDTYFAQCGAPGGFLGVRFESGCRGLLAQQVVVQVVDKWLNDVCDSCHTVDRAVLVLVVFGGVAAHIVAGFPKVTAKTVRLRVPRQ
ncbi:MAG: hypothetical protein ACR2PG_20680 [Hyphomicrobiaceae bacterium]